MIVPTLINISRDRTVILKGFEEYFFHENEEYIMNIERESAKAISI